MNLGISSIVSIGGGSSGGSSGASGVATRYAATFTNVSSGLFTHSLGISDVVVQIYDNRSPRRMIMPDDIIIENLNQVSIIFNTPQTGRIVIM